MSNLINLVCKVCKLPYEEAMKPGGGYSHKCASCDQTEKRNAKYFELSNLKALPVGDRIDKIEEWIYDYKCYLHSHGEG